jgi:metal transporter CNNM
MNSSNPTVRKRGTARSGSITENIIEAGGFKKVVLQTNSSSDIEESGNSNGKKSESNSPTLANKSLTSLIGLTGSKPEKAEETKKKRRRHRKRKSAKGDSAGGEESTQSGQDGQKQRHKS